MSTEALCEFIRKRHNIYRLRKAGEPWPWTSDPILQKYRFCNVYRNLDKETVLIHDNWLTPHREDPDVWFAMVVARLVNWWPTLESVGYPVPWPLSSKKRFVVGLDSIKALGLKVFTGAYMVRADAHKTGSKAAYLAEYVLDPMWRARDYIRPKDGDTLEEFHKRLMEYRDMGSFMAAQVVADVKYAEGAPLRAARDWKTWAAPGPGSLRGLNRVLGQPHDAPWPRGRWESVFKLIHMEVAPRMQREGFPYITGQDLQNCLCEFDKMERVRLGQGKPRARYTPPRL